MECEWVGANTKVNRSSGPLVLCVLVLETRLVWGLIDRDIRVDSSSEKMGRRTAKTREREKRDTAMVVLVVVVIVVMMMMTIMALRACSGEARIGR